MVKFHQNLTHFYGCSFFLNLRLESSIIQCFFILLNGWICLHGVLY